MASLTRQRARREAARFERDDPPARVSRDDVARNRRERLARIQVESFRRLQEQVLSEIPAPKTMPAFHGLLADEGGRLWVGEYPRSAAEARRWSVFAADGRQLATVRTPAGLEVLQVGDGFVLGRWTDDSGVEHVRVHRLDKG